MLSVYTNFWIGWIQVEFLISFQERQLTSHVQETTLRCIHFLSRNNPSLKLYCNTSFEVPDGNGVELTPSEYEVWKGDWTDDEMVELNKLLSDFELL